MTNFNKIFCTLFVIILSSTAYADDSLQGIFSQVNSQSKGAFGLNYLQGTSGRASVKSGGSPSGSLLFQAAYRNEYARELEQKYGFYTGNLFTTNYYELMGEYVYGDAYGSHGLDHETLLAISDVAMPKASKMVRNWVLEKFYVTEYPSSKLSVGFARRGIAGSEFEQKFAIYFFNFYMSSYSTDYEYLPAFLLAKNSPIIDSSALATSRKLIADSYDYFEKIYSSSSSELKGLWKIRNTIHNQLSEAVIPMINQYLVENPWYEAQGNTYLQKIRVLLTEYYAFNPQELVALANKVGLSNLALAAQRIVDEGVNDQTLLSLSEVIAETKTNFSSSSVVPTDKKASALALMAKSCDFMNKEINRMPSIDSVAAMVTILNTVYAEGFLITDNWTYFKGEFEGGSIASSKELMATIIEIGTDTLVESFGSDYGQWKSVSGKDMEKFVDNTVKASSLNTAALSLTK